MLHGSSDSSKLLIPAAADAAAVGEVLPRLVVG